MVNNAVFAPFTDSAVVQGGVGSALPAPRPQIRMRSANSRTTNEPRVVQYPVLGWVYKRLVNARPDSHTSNYCSVTLSRA
jgi:hypothetical protein